MNIKPPAAIRKNMLDLREKLVAVEEDRLAGKIGYTPLDLDDILKKVINESSDER